MSISDLIEASQSFGLVGLLARDAVKWVWAFVTFSMPGETDLCIHLERQRGRGKRASICFDGHRSLMNVSEVAEVM